MLWGVDKGGFISHGPQTMSQIFLRQIRAEAMIGIYKRERDTTQPIEIDLVIDLPSDRVFASGKVADTIDYAVVIARLQHELAERRFGLVESLAERIAEIVLGEFHAPRVQVSVAKLGILKNVGRVGVTINRCQAPISTVS
jgi:7,8-dihydroneopterin aldolase/epimerase/oxygenase